MENHIYGIPNTYHYWRREWQPTPVFLPGKLHGQRNLEVYSPWGHKESDTTELLTLNNTHPWRRKWQSTPYSCLGNPMGRGAWWATVHGVTKSQTRLSHFHFDTYQRQLLGAFLYIYTHIHIYIHIQFLLFFGCSKQHAGSLFPNQGSNPGPLSGSTESQPPDHQGSPAWCFSTISNLYMVSTWWLHIVSFYSH